MYATHCTWCRRLQHIVHSASKMVGCFNYFYKWFQFLKKTGGFWSSESAGKSVFHCARQEQQNMQDQATLHIEPIWELVTLHITSGRSEGGNSPVQEIGKIIWQAMDVFIHRTVVPLRNRHKYRGKELGGIFSPWWFRMVSCGMYNICSSKAILQLLLEM